MRRTPSPALVVALIALLVALSGSAVALKGHNSVRSDDIKNGQVRDVDLGPDALDDELAAAVAGEGPVAVAPNPVDGPEDPNPCDEGQTGVFCGGWHVPSSSTLAWQNYGGGLAPAEFFKDASGVVHLSGSVTLPIPTNAGPYFILPESFRPEATHQFAAWCWFLGSYGFVGETVKRYRIEIGPDGVVDHSGVNDDFNCDYRTLDGISFHAG